MLIELIYEAKDGGLYMIYNRCCRCVRNDHVKREDDEGSRVVCSTWSFVDLGLFMFAIGSVEGDSAR
jgi:hypothetical protein